jgi:hypothetical protein
MKIQLCISDIKWDTNTDDEDSIPNLPTEMTVFLDEDIDGFDDPNITEYICDYLSNETGFCVLGYSIVSDHIEE